MSYYDDVYLKRLNRYGYDYQSRVQGQRVRLFEDYLLKTLYRVDFDYDNTTHPGSLERYHQNTTRTQAYLLTRLTLKLPTGTVLNIHNEDNTYQKWMNWWLENIETSGYNRYVMLKMTHTMSWTDANGVLQSQDCYFYGPGQSTIKDAIKSASRSSTSEVLYEENNNLYMIIAPYNAALKKDDYLEFLEGETKDAYVVKNIDIHSTPGVSYVSLDPVPLRNTTTIESDSDAGEAADQASIAEYWLNGGNGNGST